MALDRRSPSRASETTRLLDDEVPPSYDSIHDDSPSTPPDAETPPLNKFSRADVCWILAGLWSAVFLGALGVFSVQVKPDVTDVLGSCHVTQS